MDCERILIVMTRHCVLKSQMSSISVVFFSFTSRVRDNAL